MKAPRRGCSAPRRPCRRRSALRGRSASTSVSAVRRGGAAGRAGPVATTAAISRAFRATRASPSAERDERRPRRRRRPRAPSRPEAALGVVERAAHDASRRPPRSGARARSTRQRESRAAITSNDGFSVVAPIERDGPVLDGGQERVLLGLVEAVDLVDEQDGALPAARRRSSASAIASRISFTPERTAESGAKRAPRVRRRAGGRASSCPCRAGPRGSATGGRPRSMSGAEERGRAEQMPLADELVEASAAASARRAVRPRAGSGAPPARTAPRRPPGLPGRSRRRAAPAPPCRPRRLSESACHTVEGRPKRSTVGKARRATTAPGPGRRTYQAAVRSHSGS